MEHLQAQISEGLVPASAASSHALNATSLTKIAADRRKKRVKKAEEKKMARRERLI